MNNREYLRGVASEIRKRLQVEWLYASQMDDPKSLGYRIMDARTIRGGCQVMSEGGIWYTPDKVWRKKRSNEL